MADHARSLATEPGATTPEGAVVSHGSAPLEPPTDRWARPVVDFSRIPSELGALTEWFEAMSYGLVLLEPYPLPEVARAIDRYEVSVQQHIRAAALPVGDAAENARAWRLATIVRADHTWFRTSFEQLRWFYGIVANEDHGGHRQALGQYGRLVTEAMRRHLADEELLSTFVGPASAKR